MFMPSPGAMPGAMSIQQKASMLTGRPVGLSMRDGSGVSGILCGIQGGDVYMIQYLYQSQFATFHFALNQVADILPFPACR
ncbi:hypothetical protein [Paenibacillus kobensis]|uniref:hypothetical protein n=1 Tax=Paenibacillus kobensis TaxID=59841 RepID=UPI000FD951E5|nr:hypothetical protein [Paenibacillus kobensis]